MEKKKGIAAVIIAGVLWGMISLFVKHFSTKGFSSIDMMQIRVGLSAVILAIYILIKNPRLFYFQWKDIWMFIGTGVFSLTFFSVCYFTTIVESGASIAVVLLYTSPVFILIMSAILFKERVTIRKMIAIGIAFVGCVCVAGFIGTGQVITMKALLIGIGAGFGYGLYSIFSRYALRKYHIFTIIFYTFLFSGISSIPFADYGKIAGAFTVADIPYALGLSLICAVLPYMLYTYGLNKMDTTQAAVLVTTEPLVGAVLGIVVFGESHDAVKLLGILCIFIAIILLNLPDQVETTQETQKKKDNVNAGQGNEASTVAAWNHH